MPANVHDNKGRLAKNTIYSIVAWLFPLLISFITTPILVRGFGAEQYGILVVILGFLSYLFTFGTGKVVAKFIPEYRSSGQHEKISQFVSATFWFSLCVALIGSITVALLARYIVADVLLISTDSQATATNALYLACASGVVLMAGQTFHYVLQGLHRFDSYALLINLNGLMLGLGNIILFLSGFGITALLCWNLITTFFIGLLFFIQSRRFLPDLELTTSIDGSIMRSVVKYGGSIILFQIFANALFIFERTWVIRKFGAESLTFYSVPMLLAIYLHGFIASMIQPFFPRINELLSDTEKLTDLYQKITKIALAFITFICVAYICAGKIFLTVWINADLAANSYVLLVIHSLTFALIAIMIIPLQIAEAFRFSALTAILTCIWMALTIPLMIYSANIWKSEGIALSRLFVVVITLPLIVFVERRFLGHVLWKFWLMSLVRICIAACAMALAGYSIFYGFESSWLTLFVGMLVCSFVFAGVLFFTNYLSQDERKMLRELVANGKRIVFTENT